MKRKIMAIISIMCMLFSCMLMTDVIVAAEEPDEPAVTKITPNPKRTELGIDRGQIYVLDEPAENLGPMYSDRVGSYTLAHLGPKLKGLTQIITPIYDTNRAGTISTANGSKMESFLHSEQEYFNFDVNHAGTVYVISATNLATQINTVTYSNNFSSSNGWRCLADDIKPTLEPEAMQHGGDWRYVPYGREVKDAPYYVARAQWSGAAAISAAAATGMQSPIRTPAVMTATEDEVADAINYYVPFTYAYSKTFEAGDNVSIPVVGHYTSNDNMLVFIKWKEDTVDTPIIVESVPNSSVVVSNAVLSEGENLLTFTADVYRGYGSPIMNVYMVRSKDDIITEVDKQILYLSGTNSALEFELPLLEPGESLSLMIWDEVMQPAVKKTVLIE